MTNVRTTIMIPATLLKQLKHSAVEHSVTLSELITEKLLAMLDTRFPIKLSRDAQLKKEAERVEQLAGKFSLGHGMHPKKIKNMIMKRYDDEMLS